MGEAIGQSLIASSSITADLPRWRPLDGHSPAGRGEPSSPWSGDLVAGWLRGRCQSRCQSTSQHQRGLWRSGWIRHPT
jgi:hypothetical protein